jgi:hypothetical protein
MQFMVTSDQALTLRGQAFWQEAEVEIFRPVGESRKTRIFCNICHGFHRLASR